MVWIKAKNGNSFDVADVGHARQLVAEGHEAFVSDPRAKGGAKKWAGDDVDPEDSDAPEGSEDPED